MKYFIDTEFIEGFHQPKIFGIPFGKKRHFIDLISIGIVAEDGRTYYAISNEFNPNDADQWVKDNVIFPIEKEYFIKMTHDERKKLVVGKGKKAVTNIIKKFGKTNKQIAEDIMLFCGRETIEDKFGHAHWVYPDPPTFYAYYADYDWVVFCSLFGRMIDLPQGFPMYCRDLKQMIDESASMLTKLDNDFTFETALKFIKNSPKYPTQENEHNALDDAHWNLKLYNFLKQL